MRPGLLLSGPIRELFEMLIARSAVVALAVERSLSRALDSAGGLFSSRGRPYSGPCRSSRRVGGDHCRHQDGPPNCNSRSNSDPSQASHRCCTVPSLSPISTDFVMLIPQPTWPIRRLGVMPTGAVGRGRCDEVMRRCPRSGGSSVSDRMLGGCGWLSGGSTTTRSGRRHRQPP